MAWIYPRLEPRRWDWLLCGASAAAMLAEVVLITTQQWRGHASHFNLSTPFDSVVGHWMTVLICIVTLAIFDFTWRSFCQFNGLVDLRRAVQGGLLFLVVSCLIGFVILFYGEQRVRLGLNPSTFGGSGVTKFPHGVAIHAIQFLPCLTWLLKRIGVAGSIRYRLVCQSIASIMAFLLFGAIQTLSGLDRFDVRYAGVSVLIIALLLALPTTFQLFLGGWRTLRRIGD